MGRKGATAAPGGGPERFLFVHNPGRALDANAKVRVRRHYSWPPSQGINVSAA